MCIRDCYISQMKVLIINLLLLALLIPVSSVSAQGNGTDKVIICHKAADQSKTIEISTSALDAHLAHGDSVGPCETPAVPEFGLIQGAVALVSSGGAFYFIKQKDNSVVITEPSPTPIPTVQPTQPEITSTECTDFSEMLSSCTEYSCEFTHPLTEELMTREIFGLTDGICKYSEEMPNSGRMDCDYTEEMRKAVAQAYNDMMREGNFSVSVSGNLSEGTAEIESTYTVDGKTITNPGQEALDSGQCVISGY